MSPWSQREEWPDGPLWPDAALREVTPPRGLLARLGAIPVESDADLDRLLCDVPTPAGLVGRLCQIGASRDEVRKHRRPLEQKAVAASLVVMAWCSYAAALILFWAADYPLVRATAEDWLHPAALVNHESAAAEPSPLAVLDESVLIETPPQPAAASPWAAAWNGSASAGEPTSIAEPVGEQLVAVHWPSRYSSYFDFSTLVDVPAVETPDLAAAAIPQGAGFDRDFLARTGVFPRIDPRNHPLSQPPLTTAGDGLALARQRLDAGQLPPPSAIRTEDFLAAVDYGFERPKNDALALVAAGGRAAWPAQGAAREDRSLRLLQLAVQAKNASGTIGDPSDELAAVNVRLSVRFNPGAVKSYRLCGHETTQMEGVQAAPNLDLSVGQAATAVYELELHDAGEAEIATVALEWRDPANGDSRVRTRAIHSHELAAPFSEAKPSVQLAALAIAAAETLRQSPFAESISPGEMLALARAARSGAARPQEFDRFVELFERILAAQAPSDPGGLDGKERRQ